MLLKSIKLKPDFPSYDTECINLEKCQSGVLNEAPRSSKRRDFRVRRQNCYLYTSISTALKGCGSRTHSREGIQSSELTWIKHV